MAEPVTPLPGFPPPNKSSRAVSPMPVEPPPSADPAQGLDPIALAQYLQTIFAPPSGVTAGLLDKAISGMYDPTADLAALGQKSQLAATLPTQADIEAQAAGRQAQGADFLAQQLSGVPVPQEAPLQHPNLPQLQLPDQPQTARPQVSPIAQLLAIGAGFASPKAAGQFNAAALEGAIRGAQEENERRQQRDKADIARRAMIYDASMAAVKEKQRIDESNRDTAYRNTVATTDRQMLMAKAKTEQFTAHGAADSLKAFAEKYDPAFKARDEVKGLLDQIDLKGKASADRIKSVSELLSAVHKEDTAGSGMAKDVFNHIVGMVQEASKERATESRELKVASANAAAALEREKTRQQAESDRVDKQSTAAMSRLMVEELGRSTRQANELRDRKPSQNLVESEKNRDRLQAELKSVRQAASVADQDLATVAAGGKIKGLEGLGVGAAMTVLRARLGNYQKQEDDLAKALRIEQERAVRFGAKGGTVKGTFDPNTGDHNIE